MPHGACDLESLRTGREAGRRLGHLTEQRVSQLRLAGRLRAVRVAGRWLYPVPSSRRSDGTVRAGGPLPRLHVPVQTWTPADVTYAARDRGWPPVRIMGHWKTAKHWPTRHWTVKHWVLETPTPPPPPPTPPVRVVAELDAWLTRRQKCEDASWRPRRGVMPLLPSGRGRGRGR
jgi:hypothetical protein